MVIGGGVAGMNAALELAKQGYPCHLVERDNALGGNARLLAHHGQGRGDRPLPGRAGSPEKVQASDLITTAPGHHHQGGGRLRGQLQDHPGRRRRRGGGGARGGHHRHRRRRVQAQ